MIYDDLYDDQDSLAQPATDRPDSRQPNVEEIGEPSLDPTPKLTKKRYTLTFNHLMDPDKGMPMLIREFRRIKFRGKGCESEDLGRLLNLYREWAQQLFPKLSFETFIQRVSNMGSNKELSAFVAEERDRQLTARMDYHRSLRTVNNDIKVLDELEPVVAEGSLSEPDNEYRGPDSDEQEAAMQMDTFY